MNIRDMEAKGWSIDQSFATSEEAEKCARGKRKAAKAIGLKRSFKVDFNFGSGAFIVWTRITR